MAHFDFFRTFASSCGLNYTECEKPRNCRYWWRKQKSLSKYIEGMKKIITCLLATLGLTTACGQAHFENVDVKGFTELMNDSNVVVLDVRTAEEFGEGHLEGALNIDQAQSDFIEKAKGTLAIEKTIAVYCRSGRRSASAAGRLAAEGYKAVNLKGGILAWKEAQMPVTTE